MIKIPDFGMQMFDSGPGALCDSAKEIGSIILTN